MGTSGASFPLSLTLTLDCLDDLYLSSQSILIHTPSPIFAEIEFFPPGVWFDRVQVIFYFLTHFVAQIMYWECLGKYIFWILSYLEDMGGILTMQFTEYSTELWTCVSLSLLYRGWYYTCIYCTVSFLRWPVFLISCLLHCSFTCAQI